MNIAVARKFTINEPIETRNLPIHGFFEKHRDALRNAAHLLGGVDATHIVDEITDALSRDDALSRRTTGLLHDLEDLLALENVGEPDRPEAGYFTAIDILDPVVEEICVLTDGLREAVVALPKLQRPVGTDIHPRGSGNLSASRPRLANALAFPANGSGDAK